MLSLIEIEADIAGRVRGSALAPRALRQVAFSKKSKIYHKFKRVSTLEQNERLMSESPYKQAKYIDELLPFYKKNINLIGNDLQKSDLSIILSGDHANAICVIASLKKTYPSKRIGIIWIDAHADLHNPYSSPSGNIHGMSLGVYLNQHPTEYNKRNIESDTKQFWEQLCNLNIGKGFVKAQDLVYIGLRSIEQEEKDTIEKENIAVYDITQIRKKSIESIHTEIVERFNNYDMIYISLDVDVLDPSVSKGTGSVVKNGFTMAEVTKIVSLLIKKLPVKIFEIAEINPLLDTENKMAKQIFVLLEKTIALFEKKHDAQTDNNL